jgi:glucans biosynthesis protein C
VPSVGRLRSCGRIRNFGVLARDLGPCTASVPGTILAVTEENAMTSSPAILAAPQVPAGPGQRERWADNLRVLVIAAVVVSHTAQAYLGGSPWYYMDRTTSKVSTWAFFPAYVISFFALGPLFLVAGWFSARSLAHKGAGGFARARLLRLGVPLVVFIFLIDRLAAYLGDRGYGYRPSLAPYWGVPPRYGGPYAVGSLWFVAALLAFSLAYALLRRVHPAPVTRRWSAAQVMVAAAMLIAVTAFLVWQRWPLGDTHTFMLAEWQLWPQGAGLFALGVWAGEAGSLEDLAGWARRLGWAALVAAAVWTAVAVYLNTRGQLGSAFHGTWLVMLNVVLYSVISVAFTVWFTALIRARWSGDGPLRLRAGRASYAAYVLHPLVLTAIMVLFASLALAPELKFLTVAVVAVPVCYLAGYAATRVPGISKVL